MNPISGFLVQNIVVVFFLYGLAFFSLGLALLLAARRASELSFARAIRPLAAFGILHGIHEWIEMFQKIAAETSGYTSPAFHEAPRIGLLAVSFLMLLFFSLLLLKPETTSLRRVYLVVAGMAGLWGLSIVSVAIVFRPPLDELIAMADVLSRYILAVPGALLGALAMMTQQRAFREHGMPQFGRDLVWCATALLLYGVFGQVFVRQTTLPPSTVINSALFLNWFGIPVQLFRGIMATVLTVYMIRALNAFELEDQRRLEQANQAKLAAQAAALEAERRTSRERERLNDELRQTAHELALLLELSNLLTAPMSLQECMRSALEKIVHRLSFPDAGLILLAGGNLAGAQVRTSVGFTTEGNLGVEQLGLAVQLGEQCMAKALSMCWHAGGKTFELSAQMVQDQGCQKYPASIKMIGVPLIAQQQVIGSIVLAQVDPAAGDKFAMDEFELILGMSQQVGLSIANARLYQEAQEREAMLGELLHQVVTAQEAERQRIARELHDATGQSLTAIALGLRGVESVVIKDPLVAAKQLEELKNYGTSALGELHQIISDLRPPQLDDLGLIPALQWYIQEFAARHSMQVDFVAKGGRGRLPAEYEIVLFRITQEALTNIAKHAKAWRATVEFELSSDKACLVVEDNGRGFQVAEVLRRDRPYAGWGLMGIQERVLLLGGQCEITSKPGQGTRLWVNVPLGMETKHVKDKTAVG